MSPSLPRVTPASAPRPIPARAGIGLRARHHDDLLRERPDIGWLEAHSENYFADGGAQIDYLLKLREVYPLSLHGVGLSLGSTDALEREHMRRLKRLVQLAEPGLVSEHLCWGSVNGMFANDLLPLPYTEEALRHMIRRVGEIQDFLGRQILIENVSSYVAFRGSTMPEWEFLAAVADRADCGILLDVNNVAVSAHNHGFDSRQYLRSLPAERIGQIHLAGHADRGAYRLDTHDAPVPEEVWDLYRESVRLYGRVSSLVEWDDNVPDLDVLCAESARAARIEAQVEAEAEAGAAA